ncbi:DUF4337 domain-containing protein [Thermodesulfobacteriota bacterium]
MEPEEVIGQAVEEGSREKWLSYLALTTVILAVGATLSSFTESQNSVDSVLNQTRAANQWSYFQAKSIKTYLYEMQRDKLQMELQVKLDKLSPEIVAVYAKKIASYEKDIKRYSEEKKEIMKDAKDFEKQRDGNQRKAGIFGVSVIFLQVSILLCSIAALMRRKSVWVVGSVIGVAGLIYFANGFFFFI